mmetsp:Transcript_73532/g.119337  ORF Transcript_73532/g.119337 Transcript_73532/m.119337 type:complete len:208 (-) Transcript_73532:1382-2005(-)
MGNVILICIVATLFLLQNRIWTPVNWTASPMRTAATWRISAVLRAQIIICGGIPGLHTIRLAYWRPTEILARFVSLVVAPKALKPRRLHDQNLGRTRLRLCGERHVAWEFVVWALDLRRHSRCPAWNTRHRTFTFTLKVCSKNNLYAGTSVGGRRSVIVRVDAHGGSWCLFCLNIWQRVLDTIFIPYIILHLNHVSGGFRQFAYQNG